MHLSPHMVFHALSRQTYEVGSTSLRVDHIVVVGDREANAELQNELTELGIPFEAAGSMKFVCPKMKWEYNRETKTKRRVCRCENPCTTSVSYTHLSLQTDCLVLRIFRLHSPISLCYLYNQF